MDELVNVLHTAVMRLDEMLAKLGEIHDRLDDIHTKLETIGDLSRLSEVLSTLETMNRFLERIEVHTSHIVR
jgi:hypothetical protein